MTPESVMTIARSAVELMLLVAGPLLLAALATGLVISIFQAATQINEMTLSFIPKLLAMLAALTFLGPWMLREMIDFTQNLLTNLPWMIG